MSPSRDSGFFVQNNHDARHVHVNASSNDAKKRKYILIGGVVVVLAAVGALVGVLVSKSNANASSSSDGNNDGGKKNSTKDASYKVDSNSLIPDKPPAANPTSDPDTVKPVFTMLAIGDYGGTTGKENGVPGSCCKLYKNSGKINMDTDRYKVDFYSQKWVAELMAQSAAQLKPVRVIAHGDNFYWNGVGSEDWKYRFQTTFEEVYDQPSLKNVKWVNVAGNHDVGGSMFLCGERDAAFVECTSTAEMLKYLNERFDLQAKYKSPNGDRWLMKDHYYLESVSVGGVTVDIFNVDTNHADSHGARQICCQCYGYASKYGYKDDCNNVDSGDKACAGGNREMFQACMKALEDWAQDSYKQAERDLKASKADFKIINTHYSPHFHMDEEKMKWWYKLCKDNAVGIWFNGHTHGFNHDVGNWGTHFFENGGGGGIVTETSTRVQNDFAKNIWVAGGNPYGLMEISVSKEWMKVQFISFDKAWSFGGLDAAATKIGGVARGHCYFVPSAKYTAEGAMGKPCKDSNDLPIGSPI